MITGWVRDSHGRRVALRNGRYVQRALWKMQAGYRGRHTWILRRRSPVDNGWATVWKIS